VGVGVVVVVVVVVGFAVLVFVALLLLLLVVVVVVVLLLLGSWLILRLFSLSLSFPLLILLSLFGLVLASASTTGSTSSITDSTCRHHSAEKYLVMSKGFLGKFPLLLSLLGAPGGLPWAVSPDIDAPPPRSFHCMSSSTMYLNILSINRGSFRVQLCHSRSGMLAHTPIGSSGSGSAEEAMMWLWPCHSLVSALLLPLATKSGPALPAVPLLLALLVLLAALRF